MLHFVVFRMTTCLTEKPGNVREVANGQGYGLGPGNKPCHGKWYQNLVVASSIFAFIQAFSSIQFATGGPVSV